MFIVILISIIGIVSQCYGDTCYCTCCTGNFCTPTLQGTIPVSSCASTSCKSLCQAQYPRQCTDGSGSTSYVCRSGSATTANWVGTFDLGNRCDTSFCCCPVGQLVNTQLSGNKLLVHTPLSGLGCPAGASVLDDTIDMPTSYSVQILFLNNPIQVILSPDSRTIQFNNLQYPQCSETATRNYAFFTATINMTLLFLSIGLLSFKKIFM